MYSSSISRIILLLLSALKAASEIRDSNKELKDFLESIKNSGGLKCTLCFKKISLDDPNPQTEAECDIKTYMENRSLVYCFNSVKHISHAKCLMPWYVKSFNCPDCKGELPNNLFTKYLSNTWCNFYVLNEEKQKKLIHQFIYYMKNEFIIKVLEIFKFNFEENRIESLKNFIPDTVPFKPRIVEVIDRYNSGEEKYLVIVAKSLTDQTYDILEKTFTSERLARLNPKDLLVVSNILTRHCKIFGYNNLVNDLKIDRMEQYQQKFSLEQFIWLAKYELDKKYDFKNFQNICWRMCPREEFDEGKILGFICKMVTEHDILNLDCGFDFIYGIINFYKLSESKFYGRLLNFIIDNRALLNLNWSEQTLQKVFYSIMLICVGNKDDYLKLHIAVFDFVLYSSTSLFQQKKANLIEFLIKFFNDVFENYYDDKKLNRHQYEQIEVENSCNYDCEEDAIMQEENEVTKIKKGKFEKNVEELLEHVINNGLIGDEFFNTFERTENYKRNKKFKSWLKLFESKMLKKVQYEMSYDAFN